jgi:hypothetical protein
MYKCFSMVAQLAFVECVASIGSLAYLFFGLNIWVQTSASLSLGAPWHCWNAAALMPAFIWPKGVPRYCCFRLGKVRGCGAIIRLELTEAGERVCYRMCSINEWLMCPACHSKMPNLGEDDTLWRHEVRKDDGDTAGSSSGSTVRCKSSQVKRVMKKPASK